MKPYIVKQFVLSTLGAILLNIVASLIFAIPVWALWDLFFAKRFHIPEITYLEAYLLTLLLRFVCAETSMELNVK